MVNGFSQCRFGTQKSRCAHDGAGAGRHLRRFGAGVRDAVQDLGNAEVEHFQRGAIGPVALQEQILELDVAVHDAERVRRRERRQ